jgi:hypothetical protein
VKHAKDLKAANSPVAVTVNGSRAAGGLSRREAMQWVLGAVAAASLPTADVLALPVGRTNTPQEEAAKVPPRTGKKGGYGVDPKMVEIHKPGDLWPLTFTEPQKKATAALADVILPKDRFGPSASEVGVVEMLDEWVSAPYPQQEGDRPVILEGLAWLDAESGKRFGKPFAAAPEEQKQAVCKDICFSGTAKPEFRKATQFFNRFRALAAGAYYATPAGWQAIGYVGNVALASFDGPPQEVLEKLGVTQTVM